MNFFKNNEWQQNKKNTRTKFSEIQFATMYKGRCGLKCNPSLKIVIKKHKQSSPDVQKGVMHTKISFTNLFRSTNHSRSVGYFPKCGSKQYKKTLCSTPPAFAIPTRTYEAPPETHSVRPAHRELHKEPL